VASGDGNDRRLLGLSRLCSFILTLVLDQVVATLPNAMLTRLPPQRCSSRMRYASSVPVQRELDSLERSEQSIGGVGGIAQPRGTWMLTTSAIAFGRQTHQEDDSSLSVIVIPPWLRRHRIEPHADMPHHLMSVLCFRVERNMPASQMKVVERPFGQPKGLLFEVFLIKQRPSIHLPATSSGRTRSLCIPPRRAVPESIELFSFFFSHKGVEFRGVSTIHTKWSQPTRTLSFRTTMVSMLENPRIVSI
jgi:hypothetical protein